MNPDQIKALHKDLDHLTMQTRQELTDQLDQLYATRGAAMLDGKRPDHGAITKLERRIHPKLSTFMTQTTLVRFPTN